MTVPVLVFPSGIAWDYTREVKYEISKTKLGDGYGVIATSSKSIKEIYEIIFPGLNTANKDNIINTLKQYGGYTRFKWRPFSTFSYKEYVCDKWNVSQQGTYIWQITTTLIEQK